jgi:hypothetical protein
MVTARITNGRKPVIASGGRERASQGARQLRSAGKT